MRVIANLILAFLASFIWSSLQNHCYPNTPDYFLSAYQGIIFLLFYFTMAIRDSIEDK